MSALLQTSLWDADEPLLGNLTGIRRTDLGRGAWVDHRPGWLDGAAVLLDRLIEAVPWQEQEREMYGTVVTVPRLVRFYGRSDPLPDPVVEQARETLSEHYEAELGERFVTSGFCLYRDGADSVAWHGDRIGRSRTDDTMIAILSLGSPRTLALRQRGAQRGAQGAALLPLLRLQQLFGGQRRAVGVRDRRDHDGVLRGRAGRSSAPPSARGRLPRAPRDHRP